MKKFVCWVLLALSVGAGVWLARPLIRHGIAAQDGSDALAVTASPTATPFPVGLLAVQRDNKVQIPAADLVPSLFIGDAAAAETLRPALDAYGIQHVAPAGRGFAPQGWSFKILYINGPQLTLIDQGWLRDQYAQSVMIVGLNLPASVLSDYLGVRSSVGELPVKPDRTIFTLVDAVTGAGGGHAGMTAWQYRTFDEIVAITLDSYHRYHGR